MYVTWVYTTCISNLKQDHKYASPSVLESWKSTNKLQHTKDEGRNKLTSLPFQQKTRPASSSLWSQTWDTQSQQCKAKNNTKAKCRGTSSQHEVKETPNSKKGTYRRQCKGMNNFNPTSWYEVMAKAN